MCSIHLKAWQYLLCLAVAVVMLASCTPQATSQPVPSGAASEQPAAGGAIFGWVWHDLCASGMDGKPPPAETPPGCVQEVNPLGSYHANGVLEPEEKPIGGVRVRLGQGACPATGLAEQITIETDISYSFTGLGAGTYCVSIDPMEEPNQSILLPGVWTHPSLKQGLIEREVTLSTGENKYDMNFGWDHQFKP